MHTKQTVGNKHEHWKVLFRNVNDYEPPWVVVKEGSGHHPDMVGSFFRQEDALEFVQWKNERTNHAKAKVSNKG